MRCFLHVDRGDTIIRDDEGADYVDLEAALADGRQSARELIMEELRMARPIPLDWLVIVAPEVGVARTIAFSTFATNSELDKKPESSFQEKVVGSTTHLSNATASNAIIRDTVSSIRSSLRELALLNRLFDAPRQDSEAEGRS
jgi:hypothetical protein